MDQMLSAASANEVRLPDEDLLPRCSELEDKVVADTAPSALSSSKACALFLDSPAPRRANSVASLSNALWRGSQGNVKAYFSVTATTIRRYPSILIMPLLLLCILIGLGIFGVASCENANTSKQRDNAKHLAITTVGSFQQTIAEAYPIIASLDTLIDLTRLWSHTLGNFSVSMDRMTKLQDRKLMNVQIAPQLVISAVYPPGASGGLGLDILDPESCNGCTEDAMRQIAAETTLLDGPFDMAAGWNGPVNMAFIISMPIFLNTSWPGPGPQPTWQLPLSKGLCTLPQCNVTLGAGLYRTWYGMAYVLMNISRLLELESTQLPRLRRSGWQCAIRRATPLPEGITNVREWITTDGLAPPVLPEDPVVVSLSTGPLFGGATEEGCLVFELSLAPSEGWGAPWWPAVYVLVVLAAIIICTLFFFRLQARRQKTWLLYSLLPKKVVKALRSGRLWSQNSDCCVLFADVVGFTSITSTMSVDAVGSLVGELFSIYEDLCRLHGVAKVDIIGDCFMAATGLDLGDTEDPAEKDPLSCATRAASLALDMVESCRQVLTPLGVPIEVRIGLHAGPVVGMLVGVHSPKLTVFGDVVNSCSRIQSTSLPGKIQVSAIVVNRLRQAGKVGESMELKERGEVELKGRGKARTWWLSRPEQETETTSFTCGMEQVPYPSVDVTPTDLPRRTRSHGLGAPGPITPGNILPRLKVPSEARLHSRTSVGISYLSDSRSNFFLAHGSPSRNSRNSRDSRNSRNSRGSKASVSGVTQNELYTSRGTTSLEASMQGTAYCQIDQRF